MYERTKNGRVTSDVVRGILFISNLFIIIIYNEELLE